MNEKEFRKGRPCVVTVHGTLAWEGFDIDGDAAVTG